ncbi:MAG: ATP-binding protein [Gallionellaceae bacterium]|jgi:signal transduction histidine kinase
MLRSLEAIHRLRLQITDRFPFLVPKQRGCIQHNLLAVALMIFALLVRLAIAPVNAGLQYVTFFPAVTLAAVAGGFKPGILATVIGLVFATYIFTPPYYSFSIEVFHTSFWSNMVFLIDGIIVSYSIESMHRYRQRYEKELKEVKAINKELDEFTYIASHDLKEPLRGIHNYASVIKEDCADKLDDEVMQYVNSIQRLADRMTTLTDSLLEYSRLGCTKIKKESVDVDSIMDDVTEDMSSLRSDGVKLQRSGKLGNATGDAIRIGEVFQNLIANSIKYNDKPEKLVEVGRDDKGAHPVFYVRDNGIGIPPQHKESVFRIFKRLHEQSKYGGGTGAGLTIVKKIIERHGGHIWLESVPGAGTTFYFTLCGGE